MGAYHDNLPHGAALLMIANEYFSSFVDVIPERYARMAQALTGDPTATADRLLPTLCEMEKACGVEALRMSDYGIGPEELEVFCTNALEIAGELFEIEAASHHPRAGDGDPAAVLPLSDARARRLPGARPTGR